MLNEFIEKIIVHEGEGRGNDRRQRIDIYLNFIGAFEVPAHIVTPMEAEEQRRQQEEQSAKEARSQELAQAREEKRLAHNRAWQKEWREKRQAAEPPKPRPKSLKELAELQKAGADLTPEEAQRLEEHQSRKKIARQDLITRAKADPTAAKELAEQRAYQSEATKKSRQKMYEESAAGNAEAAARYERYLAARREAYHKKKQNEKGERIA